MTEQNPELTPEQIREIIEENTIELEPQTQQKVAQDFYKLLAELEAQKVVTTDKLEAKRLRARIRSTKHKLGIPVGKAPVKTGKSKKATGGNPQLAKLEIYAEQLTQAEQMLETQAGQIVFFKNALFGLLQQPKAITKAQITDILERVDHLPTPTPETE